MTGILLFISFDAPASVKALWVLGGILFCILIILILRQSAKGRQLKRDLEELDKMTQTNVEYEFVLKAMKIAIWRYDASTKSFVYENDFREGLNSYVPENDENFQQTLTAIAPEDHVRVEKAFADICSGQTDFYHQEYRVINSRSGNEYWEESYGTIVERDDEGIPTKIMGTSMRIDDRKNMETALIQARNKAEESDRLKTAFLANMGHEIRTPLNAIVGFADLLPVVQSEEDRNQLIAEIQANNHKLLRIIDGLVSMSKIEAGAKSLMMAKIDLSQVLEQMAETYRPTTAVDIVVELPDNHLQISSDREKLQEIIDNLMQNAVKFTTEGTITLGYGVEGDQVRIWIQDTGKGITSDDQEHIFERFVKVDEYVPGAGLGLSVVKSYVDSLGGTVGVESEIGKGSRFWVLLPIN